MAPMISSPPSMTSLDDGDGDGRQVEAPAACRRPKVWVVGFSHERGLVPIGVDALRTVDVRA